MPVWRTRGIKAVSAALLIWVGGASAPVWSPASAPVDAQVEAPLVAPNGMLVSAAIR